MEWRLLLARYVRIATLRYQICGERFPLSVKSRTTPCRCMSTCTYRQSLVTDASHLPTLLLGASRNMYCPLVQLPSSFFPFFACLAVHIPHPLPVSGVQEGVLPC